MNRSFGNRFIAVILVFSILSFCAGAYGESDGMTLFSTTMLKIMDYNAKEWVINETNRAIFAVCAIMDYLVQDDNSFDANSFASTAGSRSIYVGRNGFIIASAYFYEDKNQCLLIALDTRDNSQAGFGVLDVNRNTFEIALKTANPDGYYNVDIVDFKQTMEVAIDALKN